MGGFSEDRHAAWAGRLCARMAICVSALVLAVSGPHRAQDPRTPAGEGPEGAHGSGLDLCSPHPPQLPRQAGVCRHLVPPYCPETKTQMKDEAAGTTSERKLYLLSVC